MVQPSQTNCGKPESLFALLKGLYGNYRKEIFLASFFFLFQNSPIWLSPIFLSRLIDLVTQNPPDAMFQYGVYAGLMIFVVLCNIPATILSTKFMSRFNRGVSSDLRIALCSQLQQLTLLYHDKHSVGRVQSKAIRDIEVLEQLPRQFMWLFLSTSVSILVALTATAIRKPEALPFFVLLLPIGVGLNKFFSKKMATKAKLYRESFESMSVELSDMMTMVPVARAHGLETFGLSRARDRILDVYRKGYSFDMLNARFGATGWVLFTLTQTVFLLGLVFFCFKGKITVGDVVMFYTFFISMSNALMALLNTTPVISQAREAALSISEILRAPDLEDNIGKSSVSAVKGDVCFDQVSYFYPETKAAAIRDFSLTVPAGESIAFVGPSGCGKSTLLSLLLGFVRPTHGRMLLDGTDMQNLDLRTYRHHVGVVSQDIVFFSGTVLENVRYGLDVPLAQVNAALELANAGDFVAKLQNGVDTRLGEGGVKLSGGQKQRLAIARALVRNPTILVLDEATSALDVESEMQVKEALERVMKNRTTFVVAHRLSTVRSCNRIVVMEAGSVVVSGSHAELVKHDNFYSRIVEALE